MRQPAQDIFLELRQAFFEKNRKHGGLLWCTSLLTGNFQETFLYTHLTGKEKKFRLRPLFGYIRYCLFELPLFLKSETPKTQLIVATVLTTHKDGHVKEAFFGNLLSKFEKPPYKAIVIGRVAHHFQKSIEDRAREEIGRNLYCPSHLLTKYDGLKCLFISAWSFLRCRYPQNYRRQILKDMAQSHISEVLTSLLYQAMVRKIMTCNPDARIVHPFEGNTWESVFSFPGQYSVGIQHSSILNDQTKITAFPERPLPHQIITTGPVASSQLVKLWGYPSEKIVDGYTLRQAKIFDVQGKTTAPEKIKNVLVLFQGNEHQNGALSLLREFINKNSDVRVSLRPHPAVPCEKMGLTDNEIKRVSQNQDLYADILKNEVCIYVSSTAALESIYMGVPVVHLLLSPDMDSDPLFNVPYLRRVARTADEIANALKEFEKYPLFDKEFKLAREYFDGYFRKPDEQMEERFKEWLSLSSVS